MAVLDISFHTLFSASIIWLAPVLWLPVIVNWRRTGSGECNNTLTRCTCILFPRYTFVLVAKWGIQYFKWSAPSMASDKYSESSVFAISVRSLYPLRSHKTNCVWFSFCNFSSLPVIPYFFLLSLQNAVVHMLNTFHNSGTFLIFPFLRSCFHKEKKSE